MAPVGPGLPAGQPCRRLRAGASPRLTLQPHNVSAGHALLGAGDVGSPGFDALEWAPVLDSQLHVEHDAAGWQASDGVEVGLDDLWGLLE